MNDTTKSTRSGKNDDGFSQAEREAMKEDLVWDAGVRERRRSRLLLPERREFKSRYATFGFNDPANFDDGSMWPTSFALTELTAADEKKIAALVKKAVS